MATIQLSFSLRTSSNCKTVHLLGNWDGYKGQLPMSKDSSKSGSWKGTFRFSSAMMQQGQRYWYYYIMDGYHVSHDPAQPSTVEPTTQRKLNILDIPAAKKSSSSSSSSSSRSSTSSSSRRESVSVAHGRSLSPSQIAHPRPSRPHETKAITNARYSKVDVDALSRKLAGTRVSNSSFSEDDSSECDSEIDSDASSDLPSLSSSRGSPASSGMASPVSPAGSVCSCDRYGRSPSGKKVRLDCGGSRCGSSSECASSDSEGEQYRAKLSQRRGADKRQGIAVRHSRR